MKEGTRFRVLRFESDQGYKPLSTIQAFELFHSINSLVIFIRVMVYKHKIANSTVQKSCTVEYRSTALFFCPWCTFLARYRNILYSHSVGISFSYLKWKIIIISGEKWKDEPVLSCHYYNKCNKKIQSTWTATLLPLNNSLLGFGSDSISGLETGCENSPNWLLLRLRQKQP